jgi:hypothetical protein
LKFTASHIAARDDQEYDTAMANCAAAIPDLTGQ